LQNIDFNENIARNFNLNMKKINLKFHFDSSLTCYNLEQKSIPFLKAKDVNYLKFLEASEYFYNYYKSDRKQWKNNVNENRSSPKRF
jgi:hypothetical protein